MGTLCELCASAVIFFNANLSLLQGHKVRKGVIIKIFILFIFKKLQKTSMVACQSGELVYPKRSRKEDHSSFLIYCKTLTFENNIIITD